MREIAMPRYFFHIKDGDELTADYEGGDYSDLEEARHEAIEAAREIMSWAVRDGKRPNGQTFVISDEAGIIRLEFPFKDAFNSN
jgi:hypothetical protein